MAGQSTHYSPEQLKMFAIKAKHNHDVMFIFMGLVIALIGALIVFHLGRSLGRMLRLGHYDMKRPSLAVRLSRKIRNVSVRKAPGLPSIGHVGVVLTYASINIILMFVHHGLPISALHSNLATRTGWMIVANMVLVICLAVKNTPLSYLAWSYERLNVLHQVAGYSTFGFTILHASLYSSYFVQAGRSSRLLYTEEIYGMAAAGCMAMVVFSGAVVRAWWYELFYYMHITGWIGGIVMMGLHQPEFSKKIIFVTIVVGGIWVLDRLVRLTSLAINGVSNEVTLHPLANGGTRVCVKKAPAGAVSGKHGFLWIGGVRSTETHPFTIAAMDPLEFVIASYDGFTGDLHKMALANPGVALKGSVDGVYGTFPDPIEYNTTVLIAGGSGASFTFGTALNAVKRMGPDDKRKIIFVWLVKHHSHLTWFASHIKTLEADERVSLRLYVTRKPTLDISPGLSVTEDAQDKTGPVVSTTAKSAGPETVTSQLPESSISSRSIDYEKGSASDSDGLTPSEGMVTHIERVAINYTRPDVSDIIRSVVNETPADEAVLIMGCGPAGLMKMIRNTSAACIRSDGPGIEVHCEEFGW